MTTRLITNKFKRLNNCYIIVYNKEFLHSIVIRTNVLIFKNLKPNYNKNNSCIYNII